MLNWLVIGIGDITRKRVIPAILEEPRSHLYGFVSRNPAKAKAYPGTKVWTSLEEALRDPAINAVYVASPVAFHASDTITSLRAGKHVLCEKPVALNYAEAQTMAATAAQTGQLLGIAFYRRLYPKLIRAKQLIAEGTIGQPVLVEANNHGWLESEDRAWLRDPALAGGGPLFDTGSHRIDAFNFLFGTPVRAIGLCSNVVHQLGVEDSATVLLEYEDKVRGIIDVRWNSGLVRDQFRITGTKGQIILDPLNGAAFEVSSQTGQAVKDNLPPHRNLHYPLIANFVDAALDGKPLVCDIEAALPTAWALEEVTR